jgi:hypothetical protein
MKAFPHALLAVSLLLSSNLSCLAQDSPAQTKLEGKITEASTQATLATEKTDAGTTKLFDILDENSKPNIAKTGITRKAASKVISLGNFMLDLRGFDWSVEGADVALGEKLTYKSEISREFAVRRLHDQLELDTISAIFQAGMVTGMDNNARREKLLASGNGKLVELLGEDNAKELTDRLRQTALAPSPANCKQAGEAAAWTVDEQREKFKLIVEAAVEKDPEIKNLLIRMHKFNGHSKLARVTAKVVYTTLGLAAFAPTFVAPAAEASLLVFMTATGGPEQDKLLREMYLYKCLESRYKTIHEEAHLAVTNAQVAALTGNKPLTACSIELVDRMSGGETMAKVFPTFDSTRVASKVVVEEPTTNTETESGEVPAGTLN